jgi:hypothetical protein
MKYEIRFLDGPGVGRTIEVENLHKYVWLVNDGNRKWTFTEPYGIPVETKYRLEGHAPRPDGTYLLTFGECPPPGVD